MSYLKTSNHLIGLERGNFMDEDIFWLFTLKVKPGKFNEFKRLVSLIVLATHQEPGKLAYQYAVNDDQTITYLRALSEL